TIALAHGLNLRVVAEGVETEAQLDQLVQLDCDLVQGYLFSKPIDPSEFSGFLGMRWST
ncbi:MAG: EAL domain-containing protein, partial [Acidimicrobiales bacterium]